MGWQGDMSLAGYVTSQVLSWTLSLSLFMQHMGL